MRWEKRDETERGPEGSESGIGTGGGGEVLPVGGLIQEEEEDEGDSCKEEKHEEIMKYRMHQYKENPNMKITGEDIEIAMNCDHCGPCITDQVRHDCGECGEGWVREDYTLCIIGNDVVSLFPSLESEATGRIVREEVSRSTMNVDGFNVKLGLKYISMNEKLTSDLGNATMEIDKTWNPTHNEIQVGKPQGDPG